MEDWNPFKDVATSFKQGQDTAQGYADLAVRLDTAKKQNEMQKATLAQSQEEHEFQKGSWFAEQVNKLAVMDEGKWKNLSIDATFDQSTRLGIGTPESLQELKGMLVDEAGLEQWRALYPMLMRLPPDKQREVIKAMPKFLSGPNLHSNMQQVFSAVSEFEKQREKGEIDAKAKVQDLTAPTEERIAKIADDVRMDTKDFEKIRAIGVQLDKLVRNSKGEIDIFNMSGAKQIPYLKFFNRYADSPAFYAGDADFVREASGLQGSVNVYLSKLEKNKNYVVPPETILEFHNVAQRLILGNKELEKNALTSGTARIDGLKAPRIKVMNEYQTKLIDEKLPEFVPDVDFRGNKKNTKPLRDPTTGITPGGSWLTPATGALPKKADAKKILDTVPGDMKAKFAAARELGATKKQMKERYPTVNDAVWNEMGFK